MSRRRRRSAPIYFRPPNREGKRRAQTQREQNLRRLRREHEDELLALHQRRKTRDKKRHHKQPRNLPSPELVSLRGRADIERCPDDARETEGRQPDVWAWIEVANQYHEVPNEVTLQDHSPGGEIGKIGEQRFHQDLFNALKVVRVTPCAPLRCKRSRRAED